MTYNPQSNTQFQNQTTSHSIPQTGSSAYRPSVPISIYRELSAELQATKTELDSLKTQNQQLVKQNQQLRQEVDKVLKSAQNLQQLVTSFENFPRQGTAFANPTFSPQAERRANPQTVMPPVDFVPPSIYTPEPPIVDTPEEVVVEVQEAKPRRSTQAESSSDVSGWLLAVAIILIVLTAFSTGFLIVRPLLNNNNNR